MVVGKELSQGDQNHGRNLRLAEHLGRKPLSFTNIIEQIAPAISPQDLILFDIPFDFYPGNYWRVIGIDPNEITLQPCQLSGEDLPDQLSFTVLSREPFFTGVIVNGNTGQRRIFGISDRSGRLGFHP